MQVEVYFIHVHYTRTEKVKRGVSFNKISVNLARQNMFS